MKTHFFLGQSSSHPGHVSTGPGSETAESIPALHVFISVFSPTRWFTGHSLEQLSGSKFTVFLGKWIHTNTELQRRYMCVKKKLRANPFYFTYILAHTYINTYKYIHTYTYTLTAIGFN